MSASREVTNEREQTNKNIDSLVYVVGKLVDQVREQDITIRRLEDKLDAVLGLTARKVRSPAIASPIDEKFPSDDFLQIYIKTLTGTTFNINAPHHCTIEDLKRFIENDCGIPVENQKLVYAGEQLHDERTLMEYDVKNGAQLHMVLGMRAQRNPDECQ
jgi:ubiquitin